MGCSPSKGKLFPEPENKPALQDVEDLEQAEKMTCLKTDTHVEEVELPHTQDALPSTQEDSKEGDTPPSPDPDVGVVRTMESVAEMDSPPPEENVCKDILTDSTPVKTEKKRKPKGAEKRQRTEKQRQASVGTKVDLPPHMVRAHQAAYAYLNPNISKYDTLLGLLDQAAQTHLSLQPMMGILVLRFEEINQAMEEMAEEGELMMREHGDYMAWPVTGKTVGPYVTPAKPDADAAHPPDPPPDLLQQLLQHSMEKMRLVGSSFQTIGNTTLEEKVEYFASVSRLLSDKLGAKRAVEGRLAQLLLHVEQATVRGSQCDDITLHSEDSGIGGENESLAGSERHRGRHRGSAGSGSCGSGGNVRALLDSPPNPFQNHGGLNEGGEEEEEEEDEEMDEEEEEEEENEEECDRPWRKRSNSSPPDPSRPLANMAFEHLQHRRPLTAVSSAQAKCFLSIGGSHPITELLQSQRELDQRMRSRRRSRGEGGSSEPYCNTYRGQRQRSLSGSGVDRGAAKWPFGDFQLPGGLPEVGYVPRPPGRNSVRRLINTFSQGVDGRPGQQLANIPPHIKRPRRSGALILPDIGTAEKITNGNNNNNSWPDSRDDVDSLPPPPPEVLMDDSFQSTGENQRDPGRPVTYPRTRLSQRLRASVQNVSVLPSRATVSQNSATSTIAVKPDPGQELDDEVDQERESASTLYQQARKIIHLRHVAGSPARRRGSHHLRQLDAGPPHHHHAANLHEARFAQCNQPVTAPPVSRVRLPPSCPSVHHRFPSSPQTVALSRPTSPRTVASSRPSSPRMVASSRPSSPRMVASSRPSSPRSVASAVDNNSEEIVPMVAFSTARSVFCQMETQTGHDWTPSTGSTLPGPWGDPPRGRQAARGAAGTSSRRTQSEQRPGVNSQLEMEAGRTSSPPGSGGDSHLDFGAFSPAS